MRHLVLVALLFLSSSPLAAAVPPVHPTNTLLVNGGVVLQDKGDEFDDICYMDGSASQADAKRPPVVGLHACIGPAAARHLGTSMSLLCADSPPFPAKIVFVQPAWDGGSGITGPWMEGVLSPDARKPLCLARRGPASVWGTFRLRSLEHKPLPLSYANRVKERVVGQLRPILKKDCQEGLDRMEESDGPSCDRAARKALRKANLGFFAARLPGRRVGFVLMKAPANDGWANLEGGHGSGLRVLATLDQDGRLIDVLYSGISTHPVHGIGDLDTDGYDDLLLDTRGSGYFAPWGVISVQVWKSDRPQQLRLQEFWGE